MSSTDRPLSSAHIRWRWKILVSTYLCYAGYYLTRKVFTLIKTPLAEHFGVSVGQIAHLWTAYLFAYMVGQFVASAMGRRTGPRVLLLAGLGVSMTVNILCGSTNSYWTFMAFMLVNGLAQATGWPGVVGAVAEWLRPKERGFVMGVWSTSYVIGNIMVKNLGGLLLAHWGWRSAYFGCTAVTLVIWALVLVWQRSKPQDVGLAPIVVDHDESGRAIAVSNAEHISFREYLRIAVNPIVLIMGMSYFSLKFLRYALDSWLPTFLHMQGLELGSAAYYSQIFDWAGFGGAIIAGWALDRVFRGNWALLCMFMGIGMTLGYVLVVLYGANPYALSFCFGLVGFMIYGPDTLLAGAAAIEVAGERNGLAVAGFVNGVGSIGPVVQEEIIGALMNDKNTQHAIARANSVTLVLSIIFVLSMAVAVWRLKVQHRRLLAAANPAIA